MDHKNLFFRLGTVSLRDVYDLYCFSKRVDLQQIKQVAPYRQKFIAYFEIVRKLLGLPISDKQTLTSKVFCWKHDLNITSPLFCTINRIPWMISVFLFIVIPIKMKEFFNYKEARHLLIRKMGSRKWYLDQLKIYKKWLQDSWILQILLVNLFDEIRFNPCNWLRRTSFVSFVIPYHSIDLKF